MSSDTPTTSNGRTFVVATGALPAPVAVPLSLPSTTVTTQTQTPTPTPTQSRTCTKGNHKDAIPPAELQPSTTTTTNNNNSRNNNKRRRRARQPRPEPPIVAPPVCSVCEIAKDDGPPKYKCPKCRVSYCSVACCRQHKTVCPGNQNNNEAEGSTKTVTVTVTAKATAAEATSNNDTTSTTTPTKKLDSAKSSDTNCRNGANDDDSSDDDDDDDDDDEDDSSLEDGWEITNDMMVALRNSVWLRKELQDGGLRDMIASVAKSEKKYKSYHKKQTKHRHGCRQQGPGRGHGRGRGRGNRTSRFQQQQQQQPRHPHQALAEKRNENQNFNVFTDKLLVLADVLERQELTPIASIESSGVAVGGPPVLSPNRDHHHSRNEEELEEWLGRKWNPGMPKPALALKPRRKVIPKFEPIDVSSSSEDEGEDASM
mmetsp:Transcript_2195/g.4433  ORF Transcript_2195/g.4433 Transcript_2195/m.4433 type:complete len:427 (+) Transcript_2195:238-1518(+)